MIQASLLNKVMSKKGLEVYLRRKSYGEYYWPSLFPLRLTSQLTVNTLIGEMGNRVAADVVSFDASAPLKKRPVLDSLTTKIPAIRVKRKMTEEDFHEYESLMNYANKAEMKQALKIVYDDVDFVVEACYRRMEWFVLQALSQGTISLSESNNAGIITQTSIDFKMPTGNKEYIGSAGGTVSADYHWTLACAATNDPISDIEAVVAEMNSNGYSCKYLYMNKSKWQAFRASTAVKNFVAPYMVFGGVREKRPATLKSWNMAAAEEDMPEIRVIDQRITIEDRDHDQSTVDPWLDSSSTDKYVLFAPDGPLGEMLHTPTMDEKHPTEQVIYSKKGPILVAKFGESDPKSEFTMGLINAFPSWPTVGQCWRLNTESHTAY